MPTSPLIGRELDLAAALEQLKRIEGGVPASLLVRGDAGMGKSRLADELATRAGQLGYTVLIGRADDLDTGVPYAIFRDLMVRLAGTGLVDGLRSALDGDELAVVFARAVRVFGELAADGPTVLVVEDVHLADRESLALVARLARLADIAMLTVVTLRPNQAAGEDLEHLLERMAFDGRGAVIDLQALDRHESNALLAAVLDAAPEEGLGDAVFSASRGNPFFVSEVAHMLVDGGAVSIDKGRARLLSERPAAGLRPNTAVLRRLFSGTSTDVELAKVMAVFGRFSLRHLPLVRRLVGQSAEEVTASFDRLVKAGLLAASAGGYQFTHSIVRDTLYTDIGPAERRRLHGAIAAELAKDRGSGVVMDVLELAIHVAESAEPGDEAAAGVLLEAATAVAPTAPLVSAGYLRRAADLLPAHSPRRAEALALQARSLHLGSRPLEAAMVGRQALGDLPAGSARRSTVAIVVSDLYLGGHPAEGVAVVDAELAQGGFGCPLLAQKVNLLFQAGRRAEAAELFPAALGALEAPPAAQLMAFTHLIQYANHVGEVGVANDLLGRLALLTEDRSPTVRLAAHELAAFADWRPGLADRIDWHLAAARRLRPQATSLSMGALFESSQIHLLWLLGRWDEAFELIRTASFDVSQREGVSSAQMILCLGAEMLVDRGALDEASDIAERLDAPIESIIRHGALVRARLQRALDDRAGATKALQAERERAADGGSAWKLAEVLRELADLLLEDGQRDEGVMVVAELEALAERTGWPECRLAALRARVLLDRDADVALAYRSYAEAEKFEFDHAWALMLLGELDVDAGRNLGAAYRSLDAVGAAPLRRRTAAAMRSRGLTVPRRAARTGSGLGETEIQLVRLVRGGLSNRQIATAMNYSTKTIEVYLSRIYAKTGYASRLELIRAVDTGSVALPDG